MNTSRGFGLIEGVVVLAVVGILGAGVWLWWNGGGSEQLRQQFGSASRPVPTVDVRAGWQKYTSELDGISFLYPKNWVVKGDVPPNEDWPVEVVEATSPKGLKVVLTVPVEGLGGACMEGEPACLVTVRGTDPLPEMVNGQKLYVVQYWNSLEEGKVRRYSMFVADKERLPESDEFYGLYYPLFKGKMEYNAFGAKTRAEMSFGLTKELPAQEMSVDEFFDSDEVRTAELILKSLQY